ncbi:MAG: ComEC/Rec2 family competence protein [Butyricicoccus sp.]
MTAYQASEGCYIAGAYATDEEHNAVQFEVLDSKRDSLRFAPQRIARFCRNAVQRALPEREAGLLTGLLVGGSKNLSDTDQTAFRIAGLSHLVAVSGLHIGFLVVLHAVRQTAGTVVLSRWCQRLCRSREPPSVLRGVDVPDGAGGFLLGAGRRLNGADGAVLLCQSFDRKRSLASICIHARSYPVPQGLQHALESRAGARNSCARCLPSPDYSFGLPTIFTVPILLTSFGAVSVLSPISNLMTVGVTSLCFVGGFVLCVAAAVCPALVPMLAGLVRPLISYLLWSANIIADLGFGTLHPNNTFGLAALGIVFAALLVWLTAGKHVQWKAVLPCLAVVLIGLCIVEVQHQNGQYTVTYLPCGSGQAILLSDTEHAMLIDCGSYRNAARQVREWLRWNGLKRLDMVVLTAVDQGHARDLPELMETVEVGELLMPAGCQERKTNADLLSFVHEREAQEVSEPVTLINPIAPVELFPITEGKLAVRIADEVLILHSPTEKQLSAYLEQNTLPAAAELVLSANHLSSGESMAQYAEAAGAQHIIIAARFGEGTAVAQGTGRAEHL